MHTGNEWKKGGGKAGAGLAAIVCGRSFERGYTVQKLFVLCMRKEGGWIDSLLLLFTGRCAFWDRKTPYSQWDASFGGLLFL